MKATQQTTGRGLTGFINAATCVHGTPQEAFECRQCERELRPKRKRSKEAA